MQLVWPCIPCTVYPFKVCWYPFVSWRMDSDGNFNFIMIHLYAFLLLLEGMLSLLNGIYIFHAHSAQQLLLSSQSPWAFDHFLLLVYPSLKCHLYPYHQQFVVLVTTQMAVCRNSISLKECAVCINESTVFWILLMYPLYKKIWQSFSNIFLLIDNKICSFLHC